jgi:hypothetical protein
MLPNDAYVSFDVHLMCSNCSWTIAFMINHSQVLHLFNKQRHHRYVPHRSVHYGCMPWPMFDIKPMSIIVCQLAVTIETNLSLLNKTTVSIVVEHLWNDRHVTEKIVVNMNITRTDQITWTLLFCLDAAMSSVIQTDTCLASWQSNDGQVIHLIVQSMHDNISYCLVWIEHWLWLMMNFLMVDLFIYSIEFSI